MFARLNCLAVTHTFSYSPLCLGATTTNKGLKHLFALICQSPLGQTPSLAASPTANNNNMKLTKRGDNDKTKDRKNIRLIAMVIYIFREMEASGSNK